MVEISLRNKNFLIDLGNFLNFRTKIDYFFRDESIVNHFRP